MSTRDIGLLGEEKGLKFLKKQGYKILEKNFVTNFGEIDIIAKNRACLAFVEIKYRRSDKFGTPADAINAVKQEKIIKSALQYIKIYKPKNKMFRFDALLIGPDEDQIELIKDAFSSSVRYTF